MKNAVRSLACGFVFSVLALAAMPVGAADLPSGYTRLDWIRGDGVTGRIETDYWPDPQNDIIEVDVSACSLTNEQYIVMVRKYDQSTPAINLSLGPHVDNAHTTVKYGFSGASQTDQSARIYEGARHTFRMNRNVFEYQSFNFLVNITLTEDAGFTKDKVTGPMLLMGAVWQEQVVKCSDARLHAVRVYSRANRIEKKLLHEFVPVLDDQNRPTLYDLCDPSTDRVGFTVRGTMTAGPALDPFVIAYIRPQICDGVNPCEPHPAVTDRVTGYALVEGTHYTLSWANNAAPALATVTATGCGAYAGRSSSKTFSVRNPLPAGYREVAYVSSPATSGNQPYLDTGYKPNEKTLFEIDFEEYDTASQYPCPFGVCHSGNAIAFTATADKTVDNWGCRVGDPGTAQKIFFKKTPSVIGRHLFEIAKDAVRFDGGRILLPEDRKAFQLDYNLYVFGRNNTGTMDYPVKMDVYSVTISEDGVLKRQFVPCVRTSDGAVGFYDVTPGAATTFYAKSGTGAFTAGGALAMDDIPTQYFRGNTNDLCRPRPTVRSSAGKTLVESRDFRYEWTYPADKRIGTGTVTAVGLGDYAGQTVQKSFEIAFHLPEGYKWVEYLRSTGTQYIDTRMVLNDQHVTQARFRTTAEGAAAAEKQFLFGVVSITDAATNCYYTICQGGRWVSLFNDACLYGNVQEFVGEHDFTVTPGANPGQIAGSATFEMDGQSVNRSARPWNYTALSGINNYLFACNRNGEPVYFASVDLYSFLWKRKGDEGEVYRDFRPCVRESDGEAGLFDVARVCKFYGNAGTGAFIAGPTLPGFRVKPIRPQADDGAMPCQPHPVVYSQVDGSKLTENVDYVLSWGDYTSTTGHVTMTGVGAWTGVARTAAFAIQPVLPAGYKPVVYIRSTLNGGQYINTGFKPDVNTRADFHFRMYEFVSARDFASPFGSRNANTYQFFVGAARSINGTTSARRDDWFRRFSNKLQDSSGILQTGNPSVLGEHFFSLDHDHYTLDASVTHDEFSGAASFAKTFDAYVFAVNNNNEATQLAPMDLYSLKIWDNGTLVRDFVPCVRRSDGKPGLYDRTGRSFYANAGTGEDFIAGPAWPKLSAGLLVIVK